MRTSRGRRRGRCNFDRMRICSRRSRLPVSPLAPPTHTLATAILWHSGWSKSGNGDGRTKNRILNYSYNASSIKWECERCTGRQWVLSGLLVFSHHRHEPSHFGIQPSAPLFCVARSSSEIQFQRNMRLSFWGETGASLPVSLDYLM